MGNATKHATKNVINEQVNGIAKQLAQWSKKAKRDYPQHLEDALRHAVDKLDPQALSDASANIVATVTGNRKTAKKVRKSVASTLAKAQRSYGTKASKAPLKALSRGHGALYGLGAATLILAACLAAMWRATRIIERTPLPVQRSAADSPANTRGSAVGIDPDLGPVPAR